MTGIVAPYPIPLNWLPAEPVKRSTNGNNGKGHFGKTAIIRVYIDLNMVRAGVVHHSSDWPFNGYNEIQKPRRKKKLIHYDRLGQLLGFDHYNDLQASHKKWVESGLQDQKKGRDAKWTRSLAAGSRLFIDAFKKEMGFAAKGRKAIKQAESFQLRERTTPYNAHMGAENSDIDSQNTYIWK